MRIKTTIMAAFAALLTSSAFAGEPTINIPAAPQPPSWIIKSADLDLFGMYAFGSDDFENGYGMGGSLGFKLSNILGLETEYWYLDDPKLHNGALNAVLQLPLMDQFAVRPFLGGGFTASSAVDGLIQGGVDLVWTPGKNMQVGLGYRYIYTKDNSNYQGTTLSVGISF